MAWTFQRGEDIAVPIVARGKSVSAVVFASAAAVLKRGINGRVPPAAAPVVATFAVEARGDIGGQGAGWVLTIGAAVAAGIEPGDYFTNLALTFPGGSVVKSDALLIRIEAAT